MGDIAVRVEDILSETFKRQKLSAKGVPYYAQMLVGMTVFTGQYWADRPKVSKEQLAAYIVDLAWHGLSRLDSKPQLFFEGAKARKEAERRAKRESDSGSPDSDQTSPIGSRARHRGRFRVAEHAFRGTGYATLCRVGRRSATV